MASVYLDTHIVALVHARNDKLTPVARRLLERYDILISPMVLLELQFLHEIGRTRDAPAQVLQMLRAEVGAQLCELPFSRVAEIACQQAWTRDPFDRIIVSHAILNKAPLITKDETILKSYRLAKWA